MGKDRKRHRSPSESPERRHKKDRRRRSRSRSRSRSRKDRKRSRDRNGARRSRSRDRNGDRRKAKKEDRGKSQEVEKSTLASGKPMDKEKERQELELEMEKRRERIEKWRAEKRKLAVEKSQSSTRESIMANLDLPKSGMKKWSLEDDEDEDEAAKNENGGDEASEDEDPLDKYMNEVNKEVRKLKGSKIPAKNAAKQITNSKNEDKKGIVIMVGVAKKKADEPVKKGELIEQNQDGLEYSSEEEKTEDLEDALGKLNKKGKKDLMIVDHNKIEYMPFTKDFYIEVPEIARMTSSEVELYREELEGIKVKGKNFPKPIKTWPQCGVSSKILEILKKNNYEKPTPIQAQAIPVIMSGRDMMGIAKTGSGKTLAFLLPLFRHLLAQPPLEDGDGPIAIIMTPTRELCMQIGQEVKKFSKGIKKARCVCVYGGTGISEQIAELKRGAEIIVCTPGRMIDMLAANSGRVTNLQRVTFLVLDEADRLFDMGFEPQVMRIVDNCRPDKQIVMFSATFPRQMEALARRILRMPIEVSVGGRSVVCKEVEQNVLIIEEEGKFLKLLEVLGENIREGVAIVFVDKQEHADSLLKDLMNAGYQACGSLHGGIDQYDRDSIITDFKSGKLKVLVATSVCARGLDVKELELVVNYDCPNHYEDYVHRCGRTGRAGNKGIAYTFLTPDQGRYAGDLVKAFELSENVVPVELRAVWEEYKAKQALEGKTVKSGGGFGGSGFKFDEMEATYSTEKKKFQKTVFGLQDSDDEDIEQELEAQIEELLDSKRSVKTVSAAEAAGVVTGGNVAAGTDMGSNPGANNSALSDKLELAKRAASRITLKNNVGAMLQQSTESFLAGKPGQPIITSKIVADHLAAQLNAKLNYQPTAEVTTADLDAKGQYQKYEEELVINDFPQQARWKVTSKEALAQISEYSDAGITVRGTYYPPNKPVPEGERKLFLAIESTNELAVQKAKVEITRLLKEELLKLQTTGLHQMNKTGRYKVL